MMIKDPMILKMFNKPPKKGGYTPAEIAKKYDIKLIQLIKVVSVLSSALLRFFGEIFKFKMI